MASIVPGYKYDIFISYRQKDNKGDRWVSEFVDALKTELESTFKEEISVYFDINPHDGLLETHDVNASLKEKLKCLIFIPVISQTYCDSKSFAWQYEFCAFNKLAKEDEFGRDIRLTGGNVASRILPVKIHDLEQEDKLLLENELGGVLRGIEFIYNSSGVNRPLNPSDNPDKNLNKTYYRDQINKVANAVKEIITAIKKNTRQDQKISQEVVKAEQGHSKNLKSKISLASVIVLVMIVLGYFFIPKLTRSSKPVEKSIAVLPFINDSPDKENTYFINGIMEEVLNNLQKIKDFRVLSRTSTDQYKNSDRPTLPEIAKKLGVNYIVEGSGQKYGNKFVLRVQLIAAKNERHLWGRSYDREIKQTADIINIQSEVAQLIAMELKANITPSEKFLIEKTPTKDLTAFDFYQRGKEELIKFWLNNTFMESLGRAGNFFSKALKYDSTYANAYVGLAMTYWEKHYVETVLSEDFLDSVLILSNKAIYYDNQLSDAYSIKGSYYAALRDSKKAMEEFDKAIQLNPNDYLAYYRKGFLALNTEPIVSIENLHKASSLDRGQILPNILSTLGYAYSQLGFPEKAEKYYNEVMKLNNDSLNYYNNFSSLEYAAGNYSKVLEYDKKLQSLDTTDLSRIWGIGFDYTLMRDYKEALKYFKVWLKSNTDLNTGTSLFRLHRIAFTYFQEGFRKEAEYYLNKEIENCEKIKRLNRDVGYNLRPYYDLAAAYAVKGIKGKAYENLIEYIKQPVITMDMVTLIKIDPLFDNIRGEDKFEKALKSVELNFLSQHDKVRRWLKEQSML
jgi:TolB-like protein/Tfp pilus assembly protein PilF